MLLIVYRNLGLRQANNYEQHFVEFTHRPYFKSEQIITQDVMVEKIIKQPPLELIFIIRWGNNERAYTIIENWMTKSHDKIELHFIDKGKLFETYD